VSSTTGDTKMRFIPTWLSIVAFGVASAAIAQTPTPRSAPIAKAAMSSTTPSVTTRVAVLVDIAAPASITLPMIEAGMERSKPTYQAIPGLIRKYFTIGTDGSFGGMYLWTDRTAAQAWFSPAWRTRVIATYGSEPKVTYFDVPIVLDGMAKAQ
jgi:hypothetical protein